MKQKINYNSSMEDDQDAKFQHLQKYAYKICHMII